MSSVAELTAGLPFDEQYFVAGAPAALRLPASIVRLLRRAVGHMQTAEHRPCLAITGPLLEHVWQQLNTGHWKQVHISWRHAYSLLALCQSTALYHISRLEQALPDTADHMLKESLVTCDRGLMMGAPVFGNVLASLATVLHDQLPPVEPEQPGCSSSHSANNSSSWHSASNIDSSSIARVHSPSLEAFVEQFSHARRPALITDAIEHWPALHKWSVPYIQRVAGHRLVPVEVGSAYTDANWTQTMMTVNEFVQRYMSSKSESSTGGIGYLAQHELFEQIQVLKKDVSIPDYCLIYDEDDDDIQVNAWFGPAGTVSPLHQDPRDNLFAQVFGSKLVTLVDPAHTAKLYPNQAGLLTNTSQVDVESPDLTAYPLFAEVPVQQVHVEAGQLLYMPRGWWHHVRSLQPSFSISYWFGPSNTDDAGSSQ